MSCHIRHISLVLCCCDILCSSSFCSFSPSIIIYRAVSEMMLKMKIQATTTCLLMFVVAGCTLLASVAESAVETTTKSSALSSSCNFEEWQLYHGKQQQYATRTELDKRRGIWLANQEHVEQHNSAFDAGYTLYAKSMQGPFADLEDDEFAQQYLMDPQDCSATTHVSSGRLRPLLSSSLQQDENAHVNHHPFHVDWRTKGIMTPVKSQGHCGSCWTFSTSGCLEAHVCLAAGKDDCIHWTGLAEEQLVDCAGDFNNHGCQGGLPSQAFAYLKYNGGMASEDDYPYTAPSRNGTAGTCHVPKSGYKAMVAEVFNITQYDEDDLVHAVAEVGPVSVAYQVFPDFRLYSHGIYDSYNHTTNTTMCHSGPHDVNHAVVAVGLGTSSTSSGGGGVDYYIIRNSWSADWGMEGHFWMKRGENLCGISDCASFPIVPTKDDDGFKAAAVMASSVTANDKTTMTTTGTVSALRRGRKD